MPGGVTAMWKKLWGQKLRLGRLCLGLQICAPAAHRGTGIKGLNVEMSAYWSPISMGFGLATRLKVIKGDEVVEL